MPPRLLFALTVAASLASLPALADEGFSHKEAFDHYEGTKTCLACHQAEAEAFFQSQHYQWRGNAPQIIGAKQRKLGKLNTINDFCTGPGANWIGLVHNSRGDVLSKGCSKCHAGLGRLPSETQSADQLENIDCLICHAKGYQRDLYSDAAGGLEWKPILWRNQEGLDSVSKRVGRPQRAMCLRCHSASGGGPNFKRGDLEYKLADADRNYDVHMGTDGANLQCVDCHAGRDHRMRGRGSDLSGTDAPAQPLSCGTAECHGPRPHAAEVLNQHATRVDCSVCHIPRFAREEPTDMARDWSQPHYDVEGDRYTATITFEKDVRPVYAWFNGMTRATLPGEPALRLPDGRIGMMIPEGSRKDSKARLHAFKLHKGKLPVLADRGWIVPIVVEHFFADGNIDAAVRKAAEETYGLKQPAYIWRDTLRYMGIYHGVQPAAKALACLDCHGARPVVDWKGLGYGVDPMLVRLAPPLPRRATSSKTR